MLARTYNLLLVEDHADSAAALARLLRSFGHSVDTADSGEAALQAFRGSAYSHPYDLLLIDLGLPDCDGCDLLQDLKQIREVPAIAVSAYGMQSDVDRCKAAGFFAHVAKPLDFNNLHALFSKIRVPASSPDRAPDAGTTSDIRTARFRSA